MENGTSVKGVDVPIETLVPLHEREVRKNGYNRILASIRAIGLIEPLLVYEEEGSYVILDGYLRYRACLELGIKTIPCLLRVTKEAYSANRMVNHLSPVQESRMIRQSQGTLEPETIAKTLGLASIKHRLLEKVLQKLHPEVIRVFDDKSIPLRLCARDLTFVKPEYQEVILREMEKAGEFSPAFVRALVLRAPESMRNLKGKRRNPWNRGAEHKKELAAKLEHVDRQHDFYAKLYRDYVADLLKLSIYVRKLVSHERIRTFIQSSQPEILRQFEEIIFETEVKKAP
jgi:hypothetical protein